MNKNHRNLVTRIGRGEWIRTTDPLHPMQVRFQTAPRPDRRAATKEYTLAALAKHIMGQVMEQGDAKRPIAQESYVRTLFFAPLVDQRI